MLQWKIAVPIIASAFCVICRSFRQGPAIVRKVRSGTCRQPNLFPPPDKTSRAQRIMVECQSSWLQTEVVFFDTSISSTSN
jgi:hypothetical protein